MSFVFSRPSFGRVIVSASKVTTKSRRTHWEPRLEYFGVTAFCRVPFYSTAAEAGRGGGLAPGVRALRLRAGFPRCIRLVCRRFAQPSEACRTIQRPHAL